LNNKSIVITGSTRGIGFGLAHEFLKRGCQVTINGQSQGSVARALELLHRDFDPGGVASEPGDVSDPETHQVLWDTAVATFGQVDIWINNAGLGQPTLMIWELPVETAQTIVDINVKGLIFGSQIAIRGMMKQGFGHIYNMEGICKAYRLLAHPLFSPLHSRLQPLQKLSVQPLQRRSRHRTLSGTDLLCQQQK